MLLSSLFHSRRSARRQNSSDGSRQVRPASLPRKIPDRRRRLASVCCRCRKFTNKEKTMPLARINLNKDASAELVRIVSEAVYDAMVEVAKVPANDKFQIITRHAAEELVFPADGYLGIQYSRNIIFIQVTWVAGRSTEVKKEFYKRIADDIHVKGKVSKADIVISLVDSAREDWSFGNGEMQYAPK